MGKEHRPLSEIAADIYQAWPLHKRLACFIGSWYLERMSEMDSLSDTWGTFTGRDMVNGFLQGCIGFTGARARELKAELREILKDAES